MNVMTILRNVVERMGKCYTTNRLINKIWTIVNKVDTKKCEQDVN